MRRLRPLFDPDPGWLFLIAGLAMICAVVILPAQRQLHALRDQVTAMEAEEQTTLARLKAHAAFRDLLAQDDPTLMARLAASQLNMIRRGERAVLVATTSDAPLTDWVDATVQPVRVKATEYPDSRLVRLVTGDKREWVIATSAFCIFIALVLGPSRAERRQRRLAGSDAGSAEPDLEMATSAAVAIALPDKDVEDEFDTAEFEADAFDDEEYEAELDEDDAEDTTDAYSAEVEDDDEGDSAEENADRVMLAGRDEDDDELDGDAFADDEDGEDEEWDEDEDEDEADDEDGEWEDEDDGDYEEDDESEDDEDAEDDDELTDDDETDEDEEWDDDADEDEDDDDDDDSWDDEEEGEDEDEDEEGEDELNWEADEEPESAAELEIEIPAKRPLSVSASAEDASPANVPEVEIVRRVPSVAAPRDERPESSSGMLF